MRDSKYDAIPEFLESRGGEVVEARIDDIAEAVGGLPASARRYQAWWANNESSSPGRQCHRWMQAGWRAYPQLERGTVVFRRERETKKAAAQTRVQPGERLKIEIILEDADVPLWLAFRHRGGNSSELFSQALRDAVETSEDGLGR